MKLFPKSFQGAGQSPAVFTLYNKIKKFQLHITSTNAAINPAAVKKTILLRSDTFSFNIQAIAPMHKAADKIANT